MALTVEVFGFTQKTVRKIITNKTTGVINKHSTKCRNMKYLATIRATGEAALSVEEMLDEGYLMFQDHPEQEKIESTAAMDIYVYCDDGGELGDQGRLITWTV